MYLLNRKDFLFKAGILISVPMLLEKCASNFPRQLERVDNRNSETRQNLIFEEPILNAIFAGITAPNPHNTQAWKVKKINELEMELYVDEKRILPITDPSTRQIHIGQGTFLESLKIGSSEFGYDTKIKLFPQGEYKPSEIGKKPVARVSLKAPSKSPDPLAVALQNRRTDRTIYQGPILSDKEINNILMSSDQKYTEQKVFNQKTDIDYLSKQAMDAMKIEVLNIRTGDETRQWFRFSDKEIQEKRDGLALPDQAVTGFSRWMLENFFMGPEPEKFHDKRGLNGFLEGYASKISSAKGMIFWKTRTNTLKDWVQTGFDYVRFQLAASKLGFVIHPMSQILQEYSEMDTLRSSFEKEHNIKSPEKIQMLARIGRSNYNYFTPRRNLKSFLI
jgi:hypothetical protein